MEEIKVGDAVCVKQTSEHEHYRGAVGYVYGDFNDDDEKHVLSVEFDSEIGFWPRGFHAEDLEKVGDMETWARWTLARHIDRDIYGEGIRGSRFVDGFALAALSQTIWGRLMAGISVDDRVRRLREFIADKYLVRVPKPWLPVSREAEELIEWAKGRDLDDEFVSRLQEVLRVNQTTFNAIRDLVGWRRVDFKPEWYVYRCWKVAQALTEPIYDTPDPQPEASEVQ